METHLGEGVSKEETFPQKRRPSHIGVNWELGITEGRITGRRGLGNKNYDRVCNYIQRNGSDAPVQLTEWGLGGCPRLYHSSYDKDQAMFL